MISHRLNKASHYHIPVLRDRVIELLLTDSEGMYVDGTVGGGGYIEAILPHLKGNARILGVDRDPEAITFCEERFKDNKQFFQCIQGDLGNIDLALDKAGIDKIHGFLLDLGISSHQIDVAERGFAYMQDGPLDMRMDTNAPLTAEVVINNYDEAGIADCFYYYGEERYARRLARRVIAARREAPIQSTRQLADIIRKSVPDRYEIKTLARIWQALRVEVNDELGQLKAGLEKIYPRLVTGARVVVLSYESLSDRLVKRFFRGERPDWRRDESRFPPEKTFFFNVLTRRVERPGEEELQMNPRSRSAKLRAAEKIEK
ncbi:16S rRNA (cytosine(1402)-N(4))-methyltransferase RsmH [bacterium]|nr:16S rRNA (cytosine(1402)-N(4))-methyltransferase RsmH [bacterium]